MSKKRVKVRLLFVEDGGYHAEVVSLPSKGLSSFDRLVDFLQEDQDVLKECFVDVDRLCNAQLLGDDD